MLSGLFHSVKGALWRTDTGKEEEEIATQKETTSLSGRVTRYDKTKCSGMINRTVYFDDDVIVGGGKPQVNNINNTNNNKK